MREVGPRQQATDGYRWPLALIYVRQAEQRLVVGQDVATEVEADAIVVLQQAVHAVEAADFIAAGDDEGFGRLGQARHRTCFLEHVALRAGVGGGDLNLPGLGQLGDKGVAVPCSEQKQGAR